MATSERSWRLLAVLVVAAGCSQGQKPPSLPWPDGEVVQELDLTGDGRPEVVVDPHDGATGHSVVFGSKHGDAVRPVNGPDGSELRLVRYQNSSCCPNLVVGVRCADLVGDDRLEMIGFERDDVLGTWEFTAYGFDGDRSVVRATGSSLAGDTFPGGVPEVGGYRCRGVEH